MPHPVNECIHVRRWVYCCSLCMDVCRVVGVRERDQAQLCAPGWGPSQLHYFTSTVSDPLLSEWVRRRERVVRGGVGEGLQEGGREGDWRNGVWLTEWVSQGAMGREGGESVTPLLQFVALERFLWSVVCCWRLKVMMWVVPICQTVKRCQKPFLPASIQTGAVLLFWGSVPSI